MSDLTEDSLRHILDDKLGPVSKDISDIRLSLYGKDGRSGMVGDINAIKTTWNIIKWMAGAGAFGFIFNVIDYLFEVL